MKANNILVVNGSTYAKPIEDFGNVTEDLMHLVKEPETFKLVMFTGGEDVDPSFYDETSPKGFCRSNILRDRKERMIFRRALRQGVKMTGICRGAQFLNVMCGGKMMHHIEGHATWGTHELGCSANDEIIQVNSLHHQMIIPSPKAYIIAWASKRLSHIYLGDKDMPTRWPGPEVEGIYVPGAKVCAVQWHPEMMPKKSEGFIFYNQMVGDFLDMPEKEFFAKYTGRKKKARTGFV